MPKIVKLSALLHAVKLEEKVVLPAPDGEEQVVAEADGWVVYADTEGGYVFRGFLSDREVREKHRVVV